MKIKQNIPNAITCGNLMCGCIAAVLAFKGDLLTSAAFVGLAAVLDFFDGFVARLLYVSSPIGKDLDSLADMVTFGFIPGVFMFQLLNLSAVYQSLDNKSVTFMELWSGYNQVAPMAYFGFLVTVFSCIRLARFNNDTRQSDSFIGLPTPANTIFICSLPLVMRFYPGFMPLMHPVALIVIVVVMSLLLVAELPLFALKFKSFTWQKNQLRYGFLGSSVILLVVFHFLAIPLIIVLYLLLSIVDNIFSKKEV